MELLFNVLISQGETEASLEARRLPPHGPCLLPSPDPLLDPVWAEGLLCAEAGLTLTAPSSQLPPALSRPGPGRGWGGVGVVASWGWDSGRGQVWVTNEAVGIEVLQLSQTHRLQRFIRDSSAVSGRAVICW